MLQLYYNYTSRGPGKVIRNLCLGLGQLGLEYESNCSPKPRSRLLCLQAHPILDSEHLPRMVIGPNICVLPPESRAVMSENYRKCLVPCEWVRKKYQRWLRPEKLHVWPVGIDSDSFIDTSGEPKSRDCLIYFKDRPEKDLAAVRTLLEARRQSYFLLTYGNYSEADFLAVLKQCRYGVLIDNSESQGIAVQEILSCNLPLFVWDIETNTWAGPPETTVECTSVPYWSDSCGMRVVSETELAPSFDRFLQEVNRYEPRRYILEHFNPARRALEVVSLFSDPLSEA